jgi:hypothetical protein
VVLVRVVSGFGRVLLYGFFQGLRGSWGAVSGFCPDWISCRVSLPNRSHFSGCPIRRNTEHVSSFDIYPMVFVIAVFFRRGCFAGSSISHSLPQTDFILSTLAVCRSCRALILLDTMHEESIFNFPDRRALTCQSGDTCQTLLHHFFATLTHTNQDEDTSKALLQVQQEFSVHWVPRYACAILSSKVCVGRRSLTVVALDG